MPEIPPRYWAMVAALGITWGGTFMVVELALQGITPVWLAAGRIGFASLLLCAIWAFRGFRLFSGRPNWPVVILVGVLSSTLPFILISWGLQHVTSGFAGVSMSAVPLMVLPLAHFFANEPLTLRRLLGIVIGFFGVAVLIGGQAFVSNGAELEWAGRLACLAAAACYAVSSVLVRRLPEVDPVGLATVLLLIGTSVILPVALVVEGPPPTISHETWIWLAILGLIPTAGANLLRVLVIRGAGPTFMSLTNYLVPLCAVLLGALVLGEALPNSLISALGLILAGVALSQYGALKRLFGFT
ncbi:DMT family transporter [Tritonibacter horizontis]|uniref:Putative inner membrane transporter YedA n=1 Tax=Tritonibacter horizontis TaxID=1768241 RepID=A0A132C059_9RHOB|nr:DMT family transporter [Tritonibacter horizontis]KUP93965.1 putative inner membrane transporter YedA [Tritonibacter horizontis]